VRTYPELHESHWWAAEHLRQFSAHAVQHTITLVY